MIAAGVSAAVLIPAGGVLWQRRRQQDAERELDASSGESSPGQRQRRQEDGARQRELNAGLVRLELPPRPSFDDAELEAARAAEYEELRRRFQAEQATWNAEMRRWQRERALLAEALVRADLEGQARRCAGVAPPANDALPSGDLLAHSGEGGEAWLSYEELAELRARQRRAFTSRWNARLRAAALEEERARGGDGGGDGGGVGGMGAGVLRSLFSSVWGGAQEDEEPQQVYGGASPHDPAAAEWGDSGEMDWGATCASGPGEWQPPELLRVQARPIGRSGSGSG